MYQTSDWPAAPPTSTIINKVYCMDALELLEQIPSASVDAIITDPPYGSGTQVSRHRPREKRFREIEGVDKIRPGWIPEAYRALRPGGAVYVFGKWVNICEWQRFINQAGFKIKNCIIWDKLRHGGGDLKGAYAPQYEMILFAVKGKHLLRGKRPRDLIRVYQSTNDLIHPYQKPIGLIAQLIENSTSPGEIVLDPFVGSGTTAVAAQSAGRAFVACDISLEYVELARKRLAQHALF